MSYLFSWVSDSWKGFSMKYSNHVLRSVIIIRMRKVCLRVPHPEEWETFHTVGTHRWSLVGSGMLVVSQKNIKALWGPELDQIGGPVLKE